MSTAQLGAAGVGEGARKHRLQAGRLRRVHRGVYALGPLDLSLRGRWMAAVLACGEGAALSHASAAALWGIRPPGVRWIEVTVPGRARRRGRPGILVHRAALAASEVISRERIPVTTVARTLVDLAGDVSRRELERAFDEAERMGLLDLDALEATRLASPGRRGAANLRKVMASHRPGSTLTRSPLEEAFLALCATHGLPRPEANLRVGCDTVDFLWRDARLIVETDGAGSHRTRYAFEEDRARDVRLTVAGYRVLRFTYRHVNEEPAAVVAAVRALLYRRSESEVPTSRATSNSGSG
ncbi:MAG: endonuclease domain-containing protein [Actinomycetota bacterium]|nr:endonuclease domain-containing protein [Actinomycetota bacterium]